MSRFFAFGCSYTKYAYATWADYVATNFDEYYNFALAGTSNTYSMNRLIEVDNMLNFTTDDYVIVMLTGFGRFTYYPRATKEDPHQRWHANGDLYEYSVTTKDPKIESFVKHLYSDNYAAYSSWIAAKTIKNLLESKKIPHKILMAIDNSNYLEIDGSKWGRIDSISIDSVKKTKEIYDLLNVPLSLDEWMKKKKYKQPDYTKWVNENRYDGHPTQRMHLDFVKENLPEFYTEKAESLYERVNNIFTNHSQSAQGNQYLELFHREFDKSNTITLF